MRIRPRSTQSTFCGHQSLFHPYFLLGMEEEPQTLCDMTTADSYVSDSRQKLEVANSVDALNCKSHNDVNVFVADRLMSCISGGKEIPPMEVRPVPPDNVKEDQVEGDEGAIVRFYESIFRAGDVILHVYQTWKVSHPLRAIHAKHKKRLKSSIHTHGFDCIFGLVVLPPWQLVPSNVEDITQPCQRQHRSPQGSSSNRESNLTWRPSSFWSSRKISELHEPKLWKSVGLHVSLLMMQRDIVMLPCLILLHERIWNNIDSLVL